MAREEEGHLRLLIDCEKSEALSLYKYHHERVDTIRSRLWTMLTWLAAAQGGLLVFTFEKATIQCRGFGSSMIEIEQPIVVFLLGIFGLFLARYMLVIVREGAIFMETNSRCAALALGMEQDEKKLINTAGMRIARETVLSVMRSIAYITCLVNIFLLAAALFLIIFSNCGHFSCIMEI